MKRGFELRRKQYKGVKAHVRRASRATRIGFLCGRKLTSEEVVLPMLTRNLFAMIEAGEICKRCLNALWKEYPCNEDDILQVIRLR